MALAEWFSNPTTSGFKVPEMSTHRDTHTNITSIIDPNTGEAFYNKRILKGLSDLGKVCPEGYIEYIPSEDLFPFFVNIDLSKRMTIEDQVKHLWSPSDVIQEELKELENEVEKPITEILSKELAKDRIDNLCSQCFFFLKNPIMKNRSKDDPHIEYGFRLFFPFTRVNKERFKHLLTFLTGELMSRNYAINGILPSSYIDMKSHDFNIMFMNSYPQSCATSGIIYNIKKIYYASMYEDRDTFNNIRDVPCIRDLIFSPPALLWPKYIKNLRVPVIGKDSRYLCINKQLMVLTSLYSDKVFPRH